MSLQNNAGHVSKPLRFNPKALSFSPKDAINFARPEPIQDSKFYDLPAELFIKIISYLETARDVASLSRACRRFSVLNNVDGWKVFCLYNFPTLIQSRRGPWMRLAERLTSASSGWDRRHILAHPLEVERPNLTRQTLHMLQETPDASDASKEDVSYDYRDEAEMVPSGSRANHQSLGYRPQIASTIVQSSSLDRQQLALSWSTGVDVNVRLIGLADRGINSLAMCQQFTIYAACFSSAIHDVTSLNIFAEQQKDDLNLIVGRASYHLDRLVLSAKNTGDKPTAVVKNKFHRAWENSTVRATDISKSERPLLAAISEGRELTLWNATSSQYHAQPLSDIEIDGGSNFASTWEVKFTSPELLAVGLGQSTKPLAIYKIGPDGLTQSLRLGIDESALPVTRFPPKKRSVYSIQPLSPLSRVGGSMEGDTFLTGWFDGFCRLYDLRASDTPVTTYHDPIDSDSAVYSLASFGQEGFLAGTANSILKMFDFRLHKKVYEYTNAQPCTEKEPFPPANLVKKKQSAARCAYHSATKQPESRPNANFFIYGPDPRPPARNRSRYTSRVTAPIYSLCAPAPDLPLAYVGTQGIVYEMEASHGKVPSNSHVPLSMYETNNGLGEIISAAESRLVPLLREQDFATNPKIKRHGMNRTRLGEMWLKDHEIMSLW